MHFDWQNGLVAAIVLAAAGYLLRRGALVFARRRAASCGGCGTCPTASVTSGDMAASKPLVTVESLAASARDARK